MRQRLLWYVLTTINFKNLEKERKEGKNGEEGKGGGRKERAGGERKEKKLIEFLELMTLKGRVTWCLMVCPCPRISPGPVPQWVHITGLCRRARPTGRSVGPEGNSPSRPHTLLKQPRPRGMACLWWGCGTDRWSFLQINMCPQSKHWQVNQTEVEVPES